MRRVVLYAPLDPLPLIYGGWLRIPVCAKVGTFEKIDISGT